jgi:hypothetical protein
MTEMDSEFDKLIVGEKCINLLDFSPHKFREVGGVFWDSTCLEWYFKTKRDKSY